MQVTCVHPTTKPPPKLTQSTQRLLTAVLGQSALLTVSLVAASDRLTAAAACDDRQAVELSSVRTCLERIVEAERVDESRMWARIALARLDRAAEVDRIRDEHVSLVCRIVEAGRRALRRVARAIERALTGKSQEGTTNGAR
jgi:hypothetical protein